MGRRGEGGGLSRCPKMEIPWVGGGGGGGEQKNSFRFGGVDIFWNYITLERFLNQQ